MQAYSCRALEGQELELLLQKFCRKSEEISLDWGGRYEEKPLRGPGASAWRVPPTTTSPAFRSCGGCGRSWGWTPLRLIWTFCAVTGTAPEC
ncbi:MAG: hypothetical protein ACLRWQ_04645 [Flavonifractor plautii]